MSTPTAIANWGQAPDLESHGCDSRSPLDLGSSRSDNCQNLSQRVRAALIELLPSGDPGPAKVAKRLGTSLRSLQRHLATEGSSYTLLVDRTRQELALQHLQDRGTPLGSIAFLLGFSSASAFSRAFRRWYACAPSEYRTQKPSASACAAQSAPAAEHDLLSGEEAPAESQTQLSVPARLKLVEHPSDYSGYEYASHSAAR